MQQQKAPLECACDHVVCVCVCQSFSASVYTLLVFVQSRLDKFNNLQAKALLRGSALQVRQRQRETA